MLTFIVFFLDDTKKLLNIIIWWIRNLCQTIDRQKRRFFPSYCTGNMLQYACKKFEFLSNNCSAKKMYFYIYMVLYRQYAVKLQAICQTFYCHDWKFGQTFHNLKKSIKIAEIACAFVWHLPIVQKSVCKPIVGQTQTIGLLGRISIYIS
jgi:hypothetical protein